MEMAGVVTLTGWDIVVADVEMSHDVDIIQVQTLSKRRGTLSRGLGVPWN